MTGFPASVDERRDYISALVFSAKYCLLKSYYNVCAVYYLSSSINMHYILRHFLSRCFMECVFARESIALSISWF